MTSKIPRPIRLDEVQTIVPFSTSSLYLAMSRNEFPRPIKLTSARGKNGAAFWLEHEVLEYLERKIAESRPVVDADISVIPPDQRDAAAVPVHRGS